MIKRPRVLRDPDRIQSSGQYHRSVLPGANALKIKDFRNLWLAQTTSQFGDAVYFLVFLFMARELSGSANIVGLVGALQALPFVLVGPFAGVIADRYDRRKIMVMTDALSTLTLIVMGVWVFMDSTPPIWLICVMGFTLSCINAFFMPARTAAIPSVVPGSLLMEANTLAMATQQLMGMLGLALSALVLGPVYEATKEWFFFIAIVVNACSFFVSMLFVMRLPAILPREESGEDTKASIGFSESIRRTSSDFKEGIRAILKDPISKVALPVNALINLFISGFMVVYIEVNTRWYGGKFTTLVWLEFSFAITMLLMSLAFGMVKIKRPGAAFGVSMVALGILVALMAFAKPYWLFLTLNLICGLALPFAIIPLSTYLQAGFAKEMRGRVASAWTMVSMGMQPLGLAITGFLIPILGLTGHFLFMGIGMTVVTVFGLLSRGFRETEMPVLEEAEVPAWSSR